MTDPTLEHAIARAIDGYYATRGCTAPELLGALDMIRGLIVDNLDDWPDTPEPIENKYSNVIRLHVRHP